MGEHEALTIKVSVKAVTTRPGEADRVHWGGAWFWRGGPLHFEYTKARFPQSRLPISANQISIAKCSKDNIAYPWRELLAPAHSHAPSFDKPNRAIIDKSLNVFLIEREHSLLN